MNRLPDLSEAIFCVENVNTIDLQEVENALKNDKIILVKNVLPEQADPLIENTAKHFRLLDSLMLQSAFASSKGHRDNIGRYFMTVNQRQHYQFVTPHSEGNGLSNMQLASFYCEENDTNGGETILFKVKGNKDIWQTFKERTVRGKTLQPLTDGEIRRVKGMFRIDLPNDELRDTDIVLGEQKVNEKLIICDVLAIPEPAYSQIHNERRYVYWNSIEGVDRDSASEFNAFLEQESLLHQPEQPLSLTELDHSDDRRVDSFGVKYQQIFDGKVVLKLQPGDFVLVHNLAWAHSVNNWTPSSGERKVYAAFA